MTYIPDPFGRTCALAFATLALVGCGGDDSGYQEIGQQEAAIIGGEIAAHGEFPYQVELAFNPSMGHACGGSILNQEWILTAAHCVDGAALDDFVIRAGFVTRSAPEPDMQQSNIAEIKIHPNYTGFQAGYDAALIRLATPLTYGAFVQPVTLASSEVVVGTSGVATGWGWTSSPGTSSNALLKGELAIQSDAACQAAGFGIGKATVCTAGPAAPQSVCIGDSGGPLVVNNRQVGIVSWGSGLCNSYAMFGDVYAVAPWIDGVLNGPSNSDIDGSGCVDTADYNFLVANWGAGVTASNQAADLNADGVIDVNDYSLFVQDWGSGC